MEPTSTPSAADAERGAHLACAPVREWVRLFVAGGGGAGDAAPRRHLSECDACAAFYREAVRAAACIGRERRLEREAAAKALRHRRLRRFAFGARSTRTGRLARLRTLIYPALFCVLAFSLANPVRFEPLARLEILGGPVHASEAALASAPPTGEATLALGELCATGNGGRARIHIGASNLELLGHTAVLLESCRRPRVRLVAGSVIAEGSWQVTSAAGVVRIEQGRARVSLEGGELACESLGGVVTRIDARGREVLSH